ncbi:MAG: hypothetical protein M3M96_08210, partial [Candidatus Eremiobacteraeota bacterium]|nr:hypothetical protein [Candidatus Eremiobacteraeota bacterium]
MPSRLNTARTVNEQLGPNLRISSRTVFDDDTWHLDVGVPGKQQSRIYWAIELADGSRLTDPKHRSWLEAAKTFTYRYMQGETGLDRELRAGTMVNMVFNLRTFIKWMSARGLYAFSALTEEHIVTYRNAVRVRRSRKRGKNRVAVVSKNDLSSAGKRHALMVVKHLVTLQDAVPDGPRCNRQAVFDALEPDTDRFARRREATTPRIPDNIFCDLMDAALYWVREISPLLLRRDAQFIAFQSTDSWKTKGHYSDLYRAQCDVGSVRVGGVFYEIGSLSRGRQLAWLNHLGAACAIVVAGLTGVRISELLSLRPDCLSTVRVDGARDLLRVAGTVFKTSRRKHGDATSWVAGWDEPTNPVRQAVQTLIALHSRYGPIDPTLPLFSPIAEWKTGPASMSPEFSSPALGVKANRFAAFNGISGWRFAAHQFRKTFARFVTVVAPNAVLALQRHFKHVSLQMTERYIGIDSELVDDIIEESLVLQEERLLAIVTSDRLGGIKGEEILAQNEQYRGPGGRDSARELVKLTMLDPSVRIVLHVYGACFYEETKAKCAGALANVGLQACKGCSNFAVDPSHLPFWRQQLAALDGTLSEVEHIGA